MNVFILAGGILTVLVSVPFWKQIRNSEKEQNYITWVLWTAIDTILAINIFVQDGNYLLPTVYSITAAITALFVLKLGDRPSWTWFETIVVSLVVASLIVWCLTGNKIATIASTIAALIAGSPQIVDAFRKPAKMPMLVYLGFLVGNGLSIIGGKSWSIEERLFPTYAATFCLLLILLSARRFLKKQTPTKLE